MAFGSTQATTDPRLLLQEMPILHSCVSEAVRLYPPLIMLMRQVKRSFRVTTRSGRSYTVPKASLHVFLCCSHGPRHWQRSHLSGRQVISLQASLRSSLLQGHMLLDHCILLRLACLLECSLPCGSRTPLP